VSGLLLSIGGCEVLMEALAETEPVGYKANENHQSLSEGVDLVISKSFSFTPGLLQIKVVAVDKHYFL